MRAALLRGINPGPGMCSPLAFERAEVQARCARMSLETFLQFSAIRRK
jgi:hypothetical protein